MYEPGEDVYGSPEHKAFREVARRFVQTEIAPRAREFDKVGRFDKSLYPKMGELGLLGITVDDEYGGTAMGYLAHVIAMEEISRASASVGLSYGAHSNLCVNQIRRNGSAAQKARYLPKIGRASCRERVSVVV